MHVSICSPLSQKIISAEQEDKAAKNDSRTELRAAIFELNEKLDASPEELARMIKAINDIVDIPPPSRTERPTTPIVAPSTTTKPTRDGTKP